MGGGEGKQEAILHEEEEAREKTVEEGGGGAKIRSTGGEGEERRSKRRCNGGAAHRAAPPVALTQWEREGVGESSCAPPAVASAQGGGPARREGRESTKGVASRPSATGGRSSQPLAHKEDREDQRSASNHSSGDPGQKQAPAPAEPRGVRLPAPLPRRPSPPQHSEAAARHDNATPPLPSYRSSPPRTELTPHRRHHASPPTAKPLQSFDTVELRI